MPKDITILCLIIISVRTGLDTIFEYFVLPFLGSNSVNVFLGLGLPWVITSVYLYVNKNGQILEMKDDNLLFTVLVFVCCGMTCLIILMLRRVVSHLPYLSDFSCCFVSGLICTASPSI